MRFNKNARRRKNLDPQQKPTLFVHGPNPFARLMFYSALSLVLMAIDSHFNYLNKTHLAFSTLTQPLEIIANTPTSWYRSINTYFSDHNRLIKENEKFKLINFEQSVAIQQLISLRTENEHLRSLLGANPTPNLKAILGEIIHVARDPFSLKVTVNRGIQDGVIEGQAVVDGKGVIGQITHVMPFSSEVTLITDKELSIPVQIERNGMRAIAIGHGKDGTLDIPYLPTNVDIIQGDKLTTSGIDGIYPSGLTIATVFKIERNPDSPFAHIICIPVANVTAHRQVLLLNIPPTPKAPIIDSTKINTDNAENKLINLPNSTVEFYAPN